MTRSHPIAENEPGRVELLMGNEAVALWRQGCGLRLHIPESFVENY